MGPFMSVREGAQSTLPTGPPAIAWADIGLASVPSWARVDEASVSTSHQRWACAGAGAVARDAPPAWADTQRMRRGFNTKNARSAPIQSNTIAAMKIGIQLPVVAFKTFPRGTSNDAVPFAV